MARFSGGSSPATVSGADSALNLLARDVVGNKTDTVAGNSLIALALQLLAANVVVSADSAANVLDRDVVGNKSDTVAGDSLVALVKRLLAAGAAGATEVNGPYSYLDAGAEQTVYESTAVTRRRVNVVFNNQNMTQLGTFKLYLMTDGATYDQYDSSAVTISVGDNRSFSYEFTTNQNYKLTYTESVDEAAARDIDFHIIESPLE